MITGKVWGHTQRVFHNNNVEMHRIFIRKGGYCSKHRHRSKFNSFFVESGQLEVQIWKNDYDLVDTTTLGPGDETVVKPGEFHRFQAVEDTWALEIYWVDLDCDDIEREDVGGTQDFQPIRRTSPQEGRL